MRLQKYMAEAGVASRRKCEDLIQAGRVKVNGQVAILGTCVEPQQDLVELDGKPLGESQRKVTVILHKPRGVMCTAQDPQGRPTVGGICTGPAGAGIQRGPAGLRFRGAAGNDQRWRAGLSSHPSQVLHG